MKKYGADANDGKILPEDDDDQKIAKKAWSKKDEEQLQEELAADKEP